MRGKDVYSTQAQNVERHAPRGIACTYAVKWESYGTEQNSDAHTLALQNPLTDASTGATKARRSCHGSRETTALHNEIRAGRGVTHPLNGIFFAFRESAEAEVSSPRAPSCLVNLSLVAPLGFFRVGGGVRATTSERASPTSAESMRSMTSLCGARAHGVSPT